jgi:hypothetical protein
MDNGLENIFELLSTSPVAAIPMLEGDQVVGLVRQQDVIAVTELLGMRAKEPRLAGPALRGPKPRYFRAS